jgi:MFS family permease
MLRVPRDRTFRLLFAGQVVALLGTGLATIALALLAVDLAGEAAGAVLGTALAIKMVAYVGIAPVASALVARLPRRPLLVGLHLFRAAIVLFLPFVSAIWQVYLLVFALQAASAAYTPAFQALIPDVLRDEEEYTHALSLSRLAYDLESLISPILAAAALLVVSFHVLFAGTASGFLIAAGFVFAARRLPAPRRAEDAPFRARVTRGIGLYLATPRLRGLFALNLAVAAAGAMVIVNTVVIVQIGFGLPESAVALTLAAFGAGSMIIAVVMPDLVGRVGDRPAMLLGALLLALGMLLGPLAGTWPALLLLWFVTGAGSALVQVPVGRLLRRSARSEDRPALFAAQFALSHACWLPAYLLAGRLGAAAGTDTTFLVMAFLAGAGLVAALRLWPADDPETIAHRHDALAPDHPHLREHPPDPSGRHAHPFVLDRLHPRWGEGI